MDLFRHLRIHTQKKPKDGPEEMDFPEMYLMGLGATTELPDNFESRKKMKITIFNPCVSKKCMTEMAVIKYCVFECRKIK